MNLRKFREEIRNNRFRKHTVGIFPKKAQANIVILQKSAAADFSKFCALNPVPCPIIHQSDPGEFTLGVLGEIDIRTDIPTYLIYKNGSFFSEVYDIKNLWQDDFVCFCIGCSFTFDHALTEEGIPLKHILENKNVAMYRTSIPLNSSELFAGKMVVSMRWIPPNHVEKTAQISAKFSHFHGAPVQIGNPEKIAIFNLSAPDYGDYTEPNPRDVPVFWGCGVTPQACLSAATLPIVITHKPGSMLITDLSHRKVLDRIF